MRTILLWIVGIIIVSSCKLNAELINDEVCKRVNLNNSKFYRNMEIKTCTGKYLLVILSYEIIVILNAYIHIRKTHNTLKIK